MSGAIDVKLFLASLMLERTVSDLRWSHSLARSLSTRLQFERHSSITRVFPFKLLTMYSAFYGATRPARLSLIRPVSLLSCLTTLQSCAMIIELRFSKL